MSETVNTTKELDQSAVAGQEQEPTEENGEEEQGLGPSDAGTGTEPPIDNAAPRQVLVAIKQENDGVEGEVNEAEAEVHDIGDHGERYSDHHHHHDPKEETTIVTEHAGLTNRSDDCSDLTDNNNETEEQTPKSFPQKLMDILSDETNSEIIAWLPHGNGFIIHKKKTFAHDILPKYFKASKFTSFTRKLNRWGFNRIPRGPETGAYFHKLFRRDKPELCMQMTSHSGSKYQSTPMQPQLLPNVPGMMPGAPGAAPPGLMPGAVMPGMFPYMPNPMMAANLSPPQQQALWQQHMQHMMQLQQMHMMQMQHQHQQTQQQPSSPDGQQQQQQAQPQPMQHQQQHMPLMMPNQQQQLTMMPMSPFAPIMPAQQQQQQQQQQQMDSSAGCTMNSMGNMQMAPGSMVHQEDGNDHNGMKQEQDSLVADIGDVSPEPLTDVPTIRTDEQQQHQHTQDPSNSGLLSGSIQQHGRASGQSPQSLEASKEASV